MTKLVILVLLLLTFTFGALPSWAATATPSTTASKSAEQANDKAKELLDRVATKVAELTNRQRKAYSGKIKSASTNSYSIETPEGVRAVATNDVTDFYRFRANRLTETNFAGIKAGDDIAAIGTIDPQTQEITAKQVIAKIKRLNVVGTIELVEKNILTIKDSAGATTRVDLTDATSLKKITADTISTAKIADFASNSSVFVIAHSPDEETGIFSSLKGLVMSK